MKEPDCYIEMRRRKLFEIFEMIKGCGNVVYDAMNLKMNLIIPNPKQDELDISDLLLAVYDHSIQEKKCAKNMLKEKISMSMINPGTYEFGSINNVMNFVKPLLIEGYSVAINTVYQQVPFENQIDKFEVNVGKKGCKMAIYDPDEKACDKEE